MSGEGRRQLPVYQSADDVGSKPISSFALEDGYYPMSDINCEWIPYVSPFAQHAYYFIPRSCWEDSAESFMAFKQTDRRTGFVGSEDPVVVAMHRKLLSVFCAVAFRAGEIQKPFTPCNPNIFKLVDKLRGMERCAVTITFVPEEGDDDAPTAGFLFHLAYSEVRITHKMDGTDTGLGPWDEFKGDEEMDQLKAARDLEDQITARVGRRVHINQDDEDLVLKPKLDKDGVELEIAAGAVRDMKRRIQQARDERRPDYIMAAMLEKHAKVAAEERNTTLFGTWRKKAVSRERRGLYEYVTKEEWIDLARRYNGTWGFQCFQSARDVNYRNVDNSFNFFKVFDLETACRAMRTAKAKAVFCESQRWPQPMSWGNRIVYPRGGMFTRRVRPEELDPLRELPSRRFPSAKLDDVSKDSEAFKQFFTSFYEPHLIGQSKSGFPGIGGNWTEAELRRIAEGKSLRAVIGDESRSMATVDGVRFYMQDQWARIKREFEGRYKTPEYTRAVMNARLNGIQRFDVMFHETSAIPDSLKAIARYISNLKRTQKKPGRLGTTNQYANISFYAHQKTTDALLAEWGGVYSTHSELAMATSLCLTVYNLHKKFSPDFMVSGKHGKGKSYLIQDLIKLIIDGTYLKRVSVSAKVDNQGSNARLNMMMVFFEELLPELLGYDAHEQRYSARTGSTDTAQTSQASAFRDRQTTQEIRAERLARKEQGDFFTLVITLMAHMWYLAATNLVRHKIPPAAADRWIIATYQHPQRPDMGVVECQNKVDSLTDVEKKEVDGERRQRMQRNQAFSAVLNLWQYMEIIPRGQTTMTNALLSKILEVAEIKYGLRNLKASPRPLERLSLTIESSEALTSATAIEFDGDLYTRDQEDLDKMCVQEDENGPIKTYKGMYIWQKLLRASLRAHSTTEQLVFMLSGLGPHFWEDAVGDTIIQALNDFYHTEWNTLDEQRPVVRPPPRRVVTANGIEIQQQDEKKEQKQGEQKKEHKQQTMAVAFQRQSDMAAAAHHAPDSPYVDLGVWTDDVALRKTGMVEERANQLAGYLKAHMSNYKDHYKLDVDKDAMIEWIKKQMQSEKVDDSETRSNIQISEVRIRASRHLLSTEISQGGRLCQAIEDVLRRVVQKPTTFVLGSTDPTRPFILNTITVSPAAAKDREELEIPNPRYQRPELRKFAQKYSVMRRMREADEEDEDGDEDSRSGASRENGADGDAESAVRSGVENELKRGHRYVKTIKINEDLDDYMALLQRESFPDIGDLCAHLKMGTSAASKDDAALAAIEALPLLIPSQYNVKLMENRRFKNKEPYPPPRPEKENKEPLSETLSDLRKGQEYETQVESRNGSGSRAPAKRKHAQVAEAELKQNLQTSDEWKERLKRRRQDDIPRLESPVSTSRSPSSSTSRSGEGKEEKRPAELIQRPIRTRSTVITFEESREALAVLQQAQPMLPPPPQEPTRRSPPPIVFNPLPPRQQEQKQRGRRRERKDPMDVSDAEAEAEDRRVVAEPGFDPAVDNFAAVTRQIDARRRGMSQGSILGSLMSRVPGEELVSDAEAEAQLALEDAEAEAAEAAEAAEGDETKSGESDEAEADQVLDESDEKELAQEAQELQELNAQSSLFSPRRRLQRMSRIQSRSPSPVVGTQEAAEDPLSQPRPEPEPEPEPMPVPVPDPQPQEPLPVMTSAPVTPPPTAPAPPILLRLRMTRRS